MKKATVALLIVAAVLSACAALRAPRLAAPLSYGPFPEPPDEAFRATPPPDGPLESAPTFGLGTSRLSNGVELILVERHDLPIFSARLLIGRGPRDVAGRRPELLDLATEAVVREHEASSRASPDQRPSVSCNADGCEATIHGLSRSLRASFTALADLTIRPKFPMSQLPIVQREWKSVADHLGSTADEAIRVNAVSLLFPPEDPYSTIGAEDQARIDRVTMRDLADAYTELFQPEHATLVVAGDTDMTELRELAQGAFGAWAQSRPRLAQSAASPVYPGAKGRTVLVDQRATLVHAYLVARGPLPTDATLDALSLLAMLLSTPKGALFQEVRSGMNATYDIDAAVAVGRVGSWWAIGGAFELDKAQPAVQAILTAVRRARDEGVSAADLEGARTRFIASLRADSGTSSGVTAILATTLQRALPASSALTRPARISRLTAADLQKAAQRWLSDDALRLVVVGPKKSIEGRFESLGIGAVEWRTWRGERPR